MTNRINSKRVVESMTGGGIAPTLGSCHFQSEKYLIETKEIKMDQIIVSMKGRNPDNPSDRRRGIYLEQRLEPNAEGIANALTTVQKDNLVLVRQATVDGAIPCRVGGVVDLSYPDSQTRRGRVIENGEVSPTLTTENIPNVLEEWIWEIDGHKYLIRIRKLTPRECWRLMDFSDEDFEKAESVNSNTQLYKQAGNSIVKNVLCEVFRQFIDQEGSENG